MEEDEAEFLFNTVRMKVKRLINKAEQKNCWIKTNLPSSKEAYEHVANGQNSIVQLKNIKRSQEIKTPGRQDRSQQHQAAHYIQHQNISTTKILSPDKILTNLCTRFRITDKKLNNIGKLPKGAKLFTSNAVSMYTNIDTDHGLEIINKWLKKLICIMHFYSLN